MAKRISKREHAERNARWRLAVEERRVVRFGDPTDSEVQFQEYSTHFDIGIWPNDVFKEWTTSVLPGRAFRFGHETRCEVVSCTVLAKCQPGHGPAA